MNIRLTFARDRMSGSLSCILPAVSIRTTSRWHDLAGKQYEKHQYHINIIKWLTDISIRVLIEIHERDSTPYSFNWSHEILIVHVLKDSSTNYPAFYTTQIIITLSNSYPNACMSSREVVCTINFYDGLLYNPARACSNGLWHERQIRKPLCHPGVVINVTKICCKTDKSYQNQGKQTFDFSPVATLWDNLPISVSNLEWFFDHDFYIFSQIYNLCFKFKLKFDICK